MSLYPLSLCLLSQWSGGVGWNALSVVVASVARAKGRLIEVLRLLLVEDMRARV